MKLADVTTLSRQFLRSVRIDLDWGNHAALHGYICQASARQAIETTARHFADHRQAAVTWTGPYGGGKSSLALALATLLGGDPKGRQTAEHVLGTELLDAVRAPFGLTRKNKPWVIVPVVGRRADPVTDIIEALHRSAIPHIGRRIGSKPDGRSVIRVLTSIASADKGAGVLLIIDELGQFLEYAASHGGDIHFFQELAESAARCSGRFLVIGILHQAFEQYASRLGREGRDEWAKIQGRFVDIPLVAGVDEAIELTAHAIQPAARVSHPYSAGWTKRIAKVIERNRPGCSPDIADRLEQCWPLHPVTAAILGPASKRRFGQNERSTFGFLASAEPLGFKDFLATTDLGAKLTYEPARYWDYLRTNLEPAILASPDGHRWAQGAEAVERCQARGTKLHVRLMKTIALIDHFRNGSGLVADLNVLQTSLPEASKPLIAKALKDLAQWSMAVYRKHLGAWAVFEGSDFDIDAAVSDGLAKSVGVDVSKLSAIAQLQPILPKRHYHQSGALRWFETRLAAIDQLSSVVHEFDPAGGAAGRFVLAIPQEDDSPRAMLNRCRVASSLRDDYPVAIGFPKNAALLRSLGRELLALESINATRPELAGDAVARKELSARITAITGKLEEDLRIALRDAKWYVRGEARDMDEDRGIHALASDLADETFPKAPVVHSELVNRQQLSSNVQAAANALAYAMVAHTESVALGFENYSAERGLYETVLHATGLHDTHDPKRAAFLRPAPNNKSAHFLPLWRAADKLLETSDHQVSLAKILAVWQAAPFGLRRGLHGIIGLAYILSNRDTLAAYIEGVYQPELSETFAHEVLRDPACIAVRRVVRDDRHRDQLRAIRDALKVSLNITVDPAPLPIGQELVRFALGLPPWTRWTTTVSRPAQELRRLLLTTSDPYKLLFVDLPSILDETKPESISKGLAALLSELQSAYPTLVQQIRGKLFGSLGARPDKLDVLHTRAKTVRGLSGDLRLDAFAARLSEYDGSPSALEGLMSLAVNKASRDWRDLDVDAAVLALADLALKFRHAEMLAAVKGRAPTRVAIGIAFGTGEEGRTLMRALDVGVEERVAVLALTQRILELLHRHGPETSLALAALAEVGSALIEDVEASREAA